MQGFGLKDLPPSTGVSIVFVSPFSKGKGVAMSQAKSQIAFTRAATNFDVHESDFLILLNDRISNFESLAFRFPKEGDFEGYLEKSLRLKGAFRNDNEDIIVYDKRNPDSWDAFRASEDCGCLRKLWGLATQVAKKELEMMATGQEDTSTSKVTIVLSQELEEKAVKDGMPRPLSDRERPALHTLTKVQSNFAQGGQYLHLAWETFIDQEVEGRLRRAGKLPRDKAEVVVRDDKLMVKSRDADHLSTADIRDLASLRECLDIRARSFMMLSICEYRICHHLTERYISLLRQTPLEGMRAPTINEIRRTDRLIFEEVLKWVSKGYGVVSDGIQNYIDKPNDVLWRLCDPQVESLPDQGLERQSGSSKRKTEEDDDRVVKKAKGGKGAGKDEERPPRLCLVCLTRHEPLCPLPPGFRKEQREKKKAAAKAKKASQDKRYGDSGKGNPSK